MNTDATLEVLSELSLLIPIHRYELGQRGDAAFLRILSSVDPDRWVVVSSPGDRWFGVETERKFSLDHFEEGLPDSIVREILERFVSIGLAYLDNAYETQQRGLLRTPVLVLHAGGEVFELRRSVVAELGALFRPRPSTTGS